MCVVHAQSTMMATLILLFYLTVPKDAGIIQKLHSVKLCILSFSCISVAHWYEINKWIDDHDKASVPTFKKRGTHSLLFIFFLYELVHLWGFFSEQKITDQQLKS